MNNFNRMIACGLMAVMLPATAAVSQDRPTAEELQDSFVESAKLYRIRSGKKSLRLNDRPLLNWTNPQRLSEQGALFVWFDGPLPAVIGTFFTYVYEGEVRAKHELQSVADSPLQATFDGKVAWTPSKAGVQWKDIDVGRPPADSRAANLTQMRSLARRFSVRMTDPEDEVSDLRLLPRPLLRFAAPDQNVWDGALFSFAVATDPEAFLLVRVSGEPNAKKWQYAFARFNNNQIEATLDGNSVWKVEYDSGMMMNRLGDKEHFHKIYNSFHPESDLRYRRREK